MIPVSTRIAMRTAAKATLGLGTLFLLMTEAGATSSEVQRACTSDYLAYCSQHDPDGLGVRRCMRANGLKLSMGCVNALIAVGEVSKKEVARRAGARK